VSDDGSAPIFFIRSPALPSAGLLFAFPLTVKVQ
jgi:hypothetical protein